MRIPLGNWLLPEYSVALALVGKPLPRHSLPFSGGGQINSSEQRRDLLYKLYTVVVLYSSHYLDRVMSECVTSVLCTRCALDGRYTHGGSDEVFLDFGDHVLQSFSLLRLLLL
jgi:hypothetical protein